MVTTVALPLEMQFLSRSRIRPLWVAVMIAATLAFVGCESQLGVEQALFECDEDNQCGDGNICRDRICRDPDKLESLCDSYCQEFGDLCSELAGPDTFPGFASGERCMRICRTYPTNAADDAYEGNSVQCRLNHLEAAAEESATSHCPHTASGGATICGDNSSRVCLEYCATLVNKCTGDVEQFSSPQGCLAECADYADDGQVGDESGDTIQCRFRYARSVADGVEVPLNCRFAGPNSRECTD